MTRRIAALCALALVTQAVAARAAETTVPPHRGSEHRDVDRFDTVVIDPGHGGDDQGAVGPGGRMEKDVVLDVAKRLAAKLREDGLLVVMTRESDVYVPLAARTAAANAVHGDLFVSIHVNAASSRKARGVETYFASLQATDEAAQHVATRENEAFHEASAPRAAKGDALGAILGDLIESEHFQESDEFARLAHGALSAIDPVPSRGVKQAPFFVLMGVQMPATLVEIGFITNPTDESALTGGARQDEIARSLAKAVREFGRRHDARRGLADVGDTAR